MTMYATCEASSFDPATGTCSQVVYVDAVPSWIPELSREEGAELGGAVFMAFFTSWAFRYLRKRS